MLGTGDPALTNPSLRAKYKSAYLRAVPLPEQVATIYRHLTTSDYRNPDALLLVASYGVRINSAHPRATAVA
ncbi:hypothetical protein [Saccharopolyspora elongata]|uniref:Uncharacterized protein n=1 Tax=Saccharopolyspora elongata TaxID=2530387 RepID=A0A4R4Y8F3_9PSEU|nr:hypothetical protein [Saccharopolyspora elongata]TDD40761.1 hypothetical protein E1288_34740 [Saccharopolyspora elongata]